MQGRSASQPLTQNRAALIWVVVGWIGCALLPWYDGGLGTLTAPGAWPTGPSGPALGLALSGSAWWLAPVMLALAAATLATVLVKDPERMGGWLLGAAIAGLLLLAGQGLSINHRG